MEYYYWDTETSKEVRYADYQQWQESENLKNDIKFSGPNPDDIKLPDLIFEGEGSSSSASDSRSSGSASSLDSDITVTASGTSWWDSLVDYWNTFDAWLEQQFNYWWSVLFG